MRVTGSANPQENGLFYTLGDHLGSTSLVTNASGAKACPSVGLAGVGEMRYPHSHNRHTGRSPVRHARGAGPLRGLTAIHSVAPKGHCVLARAFMPARTPKV